MSGKVMSADDLEAALRAVGAERYHNRHSFRGLLHGGRLRRGQIQAWALNRFYYQSRIPAKDASLIVRLPNAALRREWRRRLIDHDGDGHDRGGIARWLQLAEDLGLDPAYVESTEGILNGIWFEVDACVNFVRERPTLEAIASSLNEVFAPSIIAERVAGMLSHYDFVDAATLAYFAPRPTQAARDTGMALAYVKQHATTRADQRAVIAALGFKCDVLWSHLDALHFAYVGPGLIPPGAFVPGDHP